MKLASKSFLPFSMLLVLIATTHAEDTNNAAQFAIFDQPSTQNTDILVSIKGADFSAMTTEVAGKKTLHSAFVFACGSKIELDVSNAPAAKLELIRNATLQHGDTRLPKLTVKGHMEFRIRAIKDSQNIEAVPVIVVNTLTISLVHDLNPKAFGVIEPIIKINTH